MATAIQTSTIDEVLREPPKGGPLGWLHASGTFCRR
jgi:hypothetical protein